MKSMMFMVLSFLFLNLMTPAQAQTGTSLKVEGTCSGNLLDGTPVSFTYYSDYNGCGTKSASAVLFTSGIEGLFTGIRTLGNQDVHAYSDYRLSFANSTGNTQGDFRYSDSQGIKQKITVQCEVRDYEYAEAC